MNAPTKRWHALTAEQAEQVRRRELVFAVSHDTGQWVVKDRDGRVGLGSSPRLAVEDMQVTA